jgi:hypothetical protein
MKPMKDLDDDGIYANATSTAQHRLVIMSIATKPSSLHTQSCFEK